MSVVGAIMAFSLGAGVQFVHYANLTVNIRAIAHGQIGYAVLTDSVAAMVSFFIIRRVSQDGSYAMLLGMMAGGGLASWFGIWLTQAWT